MPKNRNNNNEIGKSFAIGTKIEHNDKLYEVVQGKFCNDCSIASICSSNDITSGNRLGDVISRNTRIGIFGECSSNNRDDNTSVVFKEIPKDEYYKVLPLWVYNNPTQLRPIELVLPNGHEIDVESSDLSKGIIRFKRKGYVIPYNFPLNTRRGFRTIYYLMKLSQHDMTTVIKDIIAVRHAGINFILNVCDKLEKENDCMLTSLRGD